MFPKSISKATMEDLQKDNPTLFTTIKESLTSELLATLQVNNKETEDKCATLESAFTVLKMGIESNQGKLALSLIEEGKTEVECLASIASAKSSLEAFNSSVPPAAGSGSSVDAQTIDSKEKAIEAVMAKNPGMKRGTAISMARREYRDLFLSSTISNFQKGSN